MKVVVVWNLASALLSSSNRRGEYALALGVSEALATLRQIGVAQYVVAVGEPVNRRRIANIVCKGQEFAGMYFVRNVAGFLYIMRDMKTRGQIVYIDSAMSRFTPLFLNETKVWAEWVRVAEFLDPDFVVVARSPDDVVQIVRTLLEQPQK